MTFETAGPFRISRRLSLVSLLVLAAGLLAACGSSDDDGPAAPSENGSAASSGEANDSAGSAGEAQTDSPPASLSGSDALFDLQEACPVLVYLFEFEVRATDDDVPLSHLEGRLADLAQEASPIQADLQLFSISFGPYFDMLDEMGIDTVADLHAMDDEARAETTAFVESFYTPELMMAERNITAFLDEQC